MDYVTLGLVLGGLTLLVARCVDVAARGKRGSNSNAVLARRRSEFSPHIGAFDVDIARVNPSTGLPMMGDALDIGGNAYGMNSQDALSIDSTSSLHIIDGGFDI